MDIETECRRIRDEPTYLDRLATFARFVEGERYTAGVGPGGWARRAHAAGDRCGSRE
jgi:hypothetical protein